MLVGILLLEKYISNIIIVEPGLPVALPSCMATVAVFSAVLHIENYYNAFVWL